MLQDLFELVGKIRVDTTGLDSALKEAKGKVEGVGKSFSDVGKNMSEFGGSMTKKVTLPIAAAGAAAVKVGMDFEQSMSKTKAMTGATKTEMGLMEKQARDLGKSTAFSAKEAADGMSFLGMAGFEVNDILSAMPAMLDLAGAGQLDLASASDIASNILSGFGLEADQAGHMANVLAKAASSANTDVGQLGEAMKYLAAPAKALGWNIEESAAAIQVFSNNGIQGSMAGQAFATSLQRLAKPTTQMEKKMEELGIEFFDAQGNIKPLVEIVGDLESSFDGLTAEQQSNALVTLFGAEAFKHWSGLVTEGADSLGEMESALVNSNGAAKAMRETMEDNLKGDWAKFTSALSEMALVIYEKVGPSLRSLVQHGTKLVEWFANLDPAVHKAIMIFVALLAVVGPLILIIGKFAMAIGAIITLGAQFAGIFGTVIGIFSKLGGVITGAAGMLGRIIPLIVRFATMIPRLFNPLGLAVTAFILIWNMLMKTLGITTKEAIQMLIKAIADGAKWIGQMLLALGKAIISGLTALVTGAIKLFAAMIAAIVSAIKKFVAVAQALFNALIRIVVQFIAKIIASIISMVTQVIRWFTNMANKVKSIITALITAVLGGFQRMVSGAINAAKGIASAIANGFSNALKAAAGFVKKAVGLGTDFAKGIAKGITNGAKWVKNAIVGIGKKAVSAFTDFFSIKSPSRLMATEAQWIPAGIAKGIVGGVGRVGRAIGVVNDAVKDGFEKLSGINLPSVPGLSAILPQPRTVAVADAPRATEERQRGEDRQGDVNVHVRQLQDLSPRVIQNKVERNFFSKARQRE